MPTRLVTSPRTAVILAGDRAGVAVGTAAALANLVGGLLLVTVLRLVQVGSVAITGERERPAAAPRDDGADDEQ